MTDSSMIGSAPRRVDGRRKVTGTALYASDHHLPGMAYGYGVFSTIASGKITGLDLDAARQSPGVLDIFHHDHFPELYHNSALPMSFSAILKAAKSDENRLPFEDDTVYYAGQFVALVVADTFEHARAAAYKVKVRYSQASAAANLDQGMKAGTPQDGSPNHSRGDAGAAFERAAHRIDATYTTPVETHNPMEMHATVAHWDDGRLIVYEASQGVVAHRNSLAKIFGLMPERVEVRAPFIGSGFGSKLWVWPHSVAACGAARALGRPVQLVVPRQQMFTTTGHRPETRQRLRLATDEKGKLVSVRHESINSTSFTDPYKENCGTSTKSLYSCANVLVTHQTIQVNRGTPTSMRAPGAAPGLFALESAMDEMAENLGMDPLAFRKLNVADRDESQNLPWSSNHLQECIDKAAERFGWSRRNPQPGSMKDGHEIIGYGMAACNWDAYRTPAEAQVSLRADGTAYAICGVQDIGTGTYTIVAQVVSSLTGIALDKIDVELGNSSFPPAPVSGGSWATASVMPAIAEATRQAIEQLKGFSTAPKGVFAGAKADDISFENGQLKSGGKSFAIVDVLKAQKQSSAFGEAKTGMNDTSKHSFRSFGVHFVEVRWDPGISRLRVARVVSAIDVGKVVNQKTALNQVEGAIVMGVGMALFEATDYDERNGLPVNNNYAEYVVPVHADQPDIDVILLDYPDLELNEFGARGIGEIGITGLAAAVANAVAHATGKRIRDLPITLDKLMELPPTMSA
ncbi:xanthine dehydrogenase family protein molybdopterin-binding subunit [Pseudomonas sp. GD03842]|uniref:xanthine dehydrogenase family protein molybdopterin-binding subunit n=1 Tax=Pseudomonas sp. GD03842 TaxID=2975385 RepID=UPI00244ABC12|nr:xanthine dehydrogenase family protein molybdopterin-binding subunit [Pseudomonas sp. GD03842]MDH0744869.1 xanthine dehydrogenase family protein molybdopterin-binding subunit [Pseudomonas sp. GD03842]